MHCTKCGATVNDGAGVCPACGTPVPASGTPVADNQAAPAGVAVPNYMIGSILTTLFCCLISGIVAIVYSSQVNTKLAQGDIEGAKAASKTAKTWIIINLAIGLLYALLVIAAVLAAVAIPNFVKYRSESRVETTCALIASVNTATMMYSLKHGGKYPDSLDTLTQETDDEEALLQGDYVDPWGTELRYERRGRRRPLIISAGPDREFGTADDITND